MEQQQPKQNNDKRNKIIRISVTAGLAIVLAVITSMFILSAINKPKVTQKPQAHQAVQETAPEQQPQAQPKQDTGISQDAVMNAISIALFDNGLSSSNIKENTVEDVNGKTQIHLVIDRADADMAKLRKGIETKLSEMGVSVSGEKRITASYGNMIVLIDFTHKGEKQAALPTATEQTAPAQKTVQSAPVPTGNYSGVRVAFIIDDCGYSTALAQKLSSIKYPLAMAVIPYTPYSKQTADIIHAHGKALFLHQPMQPKAYPSVDPGKGAILLNMPESLVDISLKNNVADLGGRIDGFNNHMGSALTESADKMDQVFATMKKFTNFYVDSYTSPASVAYDECKKAGMACAQNRKFIDNESDPDYIRGKLMDGIKQAKANGSIIMIGHLRDNTVAVLMDMLPKLASMGVQIVPVRELASK